MIKVLNLYSGLGGNAIKWDRSKYDITSVERREDLCNYYCDKNLSDSIVCDDAKQFLLENYQKYDFVWASPPCPTHGQYRYRVGVMGKGYDPVYPDMELYQIIIFLQHHFNGKYCVENTISYYDPLIQPQKIHRHYVWANFQISSINLPSDKIRSSNSIAAMEAVRGIDLGGYRIKDKRQALRNCTNSDLGLHILESAYK